MTTTLTAPPLTKRLATFLDLIKFSHSIFALPFALIATFLASRAINLSWPGPARLTLILLCMVLARTLAMTVNRLVDRRFDAQNPRTARRPSVTGEVTVSFMLTTIALCTLLFLATTSAFWFLFANPLPLILALPVLAWLSLYSFTKRFTALCHFWLGISLGLAPISAWIAIAPPHAPALTPTILLLGLAVMFWVAGFDILYALQDEQIDRAAHLHSIPAAVGRRNALKFSKLSHLFCVIALFAVGWITPLHTLYWIAIAIASALLFIEQSLVTADDISRINLAFMTINGLVGLLFGTLAILDVLLLGNP